jgi:hypothetical protein
MNDCFWLEGVQKLARTLHIEQIELVGFRPRNVYRMFPILPAAAFSESTALSKIADPKSPLAPVTNNMLPPVAKNSAESGA